MTPQLSIIVPIFNEEESLLPMAEGLAAVLDPLVGSGQWQFVLVDNGSRDRTPEIVKQICIRWPESVSIELDAPDYGNALFAGIDAADARYAAIINVDFWNETFLQWCWHHRGLYDLVLGSKRADIGLNQQPRYRRTLSWGLNTVLQFLFGFVGTDTHGQKFLDLDAMRPLCGECVMRRGQFDTEFTLRAMRTGRWIAEVPVPIVELRPKRNLMVKKITQNLLDITRLKRALRDLPADRPVRYHRWAWQDLVDGASEPSERLLAIQERRRTVEIEVVAQDAPVRATASNES